MEFLSFLIGTPFLVNNQNVLGKRGHLHRDRPGILTNTHTSEGVSIVEEVSFLYILESRNPYD